MRHLPKKKILQFALLSALVLLVSVPVYVRLGRTSEFLGPPPNDRDPKAPSSVCHTPQCIAAFESGGRNARRIPSLRHILWKSSHVSRYFADQLMTWGRIHPDWKFVLWRDSDLDDFVAKHYPGVLTKYRSLSHYFMRIDMIRYMIMHRFGGVYADLDYTLVRPLDRFQTFPVVVSRETEAHSLFHFGMRDWPPPLLASPGFLMSEPRNAFFQYCISQLACKSTESLVEFTGPLGLSNLLLEFSQAFPVAASPELAVYLPASRSFYPYKDNILNTSIAHQEAISSTLRSMCSGLRRSSSRNLTAYCANALVLDPLTDPAELVYAVHDNLKPRSTYAMDESLGLHDNPVDIRSLVPTVVMADTIY